MALTPDETQEYLKFTGADEAENLEKAKENFQKLYISEKDHKAKIGKITGSLTAVAKKVFAPFGLTLTDDHFKDKKVEDIFSWAGEETKKLVDAKVIELESLTKDTDVGKLNKEWDEKVKAAEKKAEREIKKTQEAVDALSTYKGEVSVKEKAVRIENRFDKILQSVPNLKTDLRPYQLSGFKSQLFEKVIFDYDEQGNEIFIDRKTNEPLKNPNKAGVDLTIEEFVLNAAIEDDLVSKNVHADRRSLPAIPGRSNSYADDITPEMKEKMQGVNPAFLGV